MPSTFQQLSTMPCSSSWLASPCVVHCGEDICFDLAAEAWVTLLDFLMPSSVQQVFEGSDNICCLSDVRSSAAGCCRDVSRTRLQEWMT